jgi:nucleotide-binding universal stress UspA family protein
MQTLRTIVVGTDFSDCAEQALDAAVVLASLCRARVVLVHVCVLSAERDAVDAGFDSELLVACQEALTSVVARYRDRGIDITGILRSGRAAEKLSNVAAEVGASVVVIGRNGDRGQRAEPGSLAERLLQTSTRPILVVPSDSMRVLTAEAS